MVSSYFSLETTYDTKDCALKCVILCGFLFRNGILFESCTELGVGEERDPVLPAGQDKDIRRREPGAADSLAGGGLQHLLGARLSFRRVSERK